MFFGRARSKRRPGDGTPTLQQRGWRHKVQRSACGISPDSTLNFRHDDVNMAPLVDNPQIKQASLHNPLPLQLHTYVWPFLILWPAFSAIYLSPTRYETYIQSSEWTFVWMAG